MAMFNNQRVSKMDTAVLFVNHSSLEWLGSCSIVLPKEGLFWRVTHEIGSLKIDSLRQIQYHWHQERNNSMDPYGNLNWETEIWNNGNVGYLYIFLAILTCESIHSPRPPIFSWSHPKICYPRFAGQNTHKPWTGDHEPIPNLVGGLELFFSIQLGMSSSQLTFTPSFFRGLGLKTTNQMPWKFPLDPIKPP